MTDRNGGPAFPDSLAEEPSYGSEGMSLRDYFATAALPGVMRYATQLEDAVLKHDALQPDNLAQGAYRLADAMLEARKGKEAQE